MPGRAPLISNQVRYSLLERGIEREVAPACAELGLGLLAYSPLGGGVLTGKYRSGVPADSRGAAQGRNLSSYSDARQVGIVEAVATAADGLATSPITVALSWLRNRPGVAALDRRGAHPRPTHRRRPVAGGGAAAGDPAGPGRRVDALPRLPRGRPLSRSDPAAERVFAAFCSSGLWPGLGSTLAAELAEAGIRVPDDVTATALAGAAQGRPGPGRPAALGSFIAAGPAYQVVELLVAAQLPARWAARVLELFGPAAHRLLRDDPWRLLQVNGVDVPDADALARVAIAGVARSDPRRSRALVGFALARAARDGHTVWPAAEVAHDLQLYRVPDTDAAVADALAGDQVHSAGTGPDGEPLLALARYYRAEQEIADSIHRLTRPASPIGARPAPAIPAGLR